MKGSEMKHPHAEILQAYALDMTVDIEGSRSDETWYLTTIDEAIYNPSQTFRIKPKERSITIDGVEYKFPEPMRVAPEIGSRYFVARLFGGCSKCTWDESGFDTDSLNAGFLQATEAGAQAQRRAIIALNGGVE
jgi:hypothetical protein